MEKARCGLGNCQPCVLAVGKSKRKKTNDVYEVTCVDCMESGAADPGTYIGETSQTLA